MTATHELNEDVLRKIVDFNIGAGIDGFWVAGGSGESILLDDDENARIAEIVVQQSNGRAKIIMHVGAPTTKRAARMAEMAARAAIGVTVGALGGFTGNPCRDIWLNSPLTKSALDVRCLI